MMDLKNCLIACDHKNGDFVTKSDLKTKMNQRHCKIPSEFYAQLMEDICIPCGVGDDVVSYKKFMQIFKIFSNLPIVKRSQSNNSDCFKSSQDLYSEKDLKVASQLKPIFRLLHNKIEEHFKNYREAFRKFDVNHNNKITFADFAKGLEGMGVTLNLAVIRAVFSAVDNNHNKSIQFNEF